MAELLSKRQPDFDLEQPPTKKRRRLSTDEIEKRNEEKLRKQEEIKRKREEEKQKREEEKLKKEKEREEKALEKEKLKKQREEEKKKREEEKLKKEKEREEKALEREKLKKQKEEEKKKREEERLEKQKQKEQEKQEKIKSKQEKERKQNEKLKQKKLEMEKSKALLIGSVFGSKSNNKKEKKAEICITTSDPNLNCSNDIKSLSRCDSKTNIEVKFNPFLPDKYETQIFSTATGKTTLAPFVPKRGKSQEDIDCELKKNDYNVDELKKSIVESKKVYKRTKEFKIDNKLWKKAFSMEGRPAVVFNFTKESKLINGRKPFHRDEIIDYDIDSDEEWEEGGAEDIDNQSDEEGDPMDMEEYDEFLVPDGYLSDEEGLGDGTDNIKSSERNIFKEKPIYTEKLYTYTSPSSKNYFPVVPLFGKSFPITEKSIKEDAVKSVTVSKLLRPVSDDALPELVQLLHNSTDSVVKVITCFKTK